MQSEYIAEIFIKKNSLFKEVKNTKTDEIFKFNLTLDPNEKNKISIADK